jgi:ATP/maltotriose-dependent transcriptional regulator MalT/DNA-binding SARP family transcriptional activator
MGRAHPVADVDRVPPFEPLTMPRKPVSSLEAKFLPPLLAVTLPRERLFAWLDGQAGVPLAWISGAPGMGKTTLLASYLAARKIHFVWFRCDVEDATLTSFFSHLGRACESSLEKRKKLPVYSREMWPRPALYAETFFRALFASVPARFAIVFDNLEQSGLEDIEALILAAVNEATPGIRIFVTSRPMPGNGVLALAARQRLAILGDAALGFDENESRELAARVGVTPEFLVAASQRLKGWAAGLTLAYTFERLRVNDPFSAVAPAEDLARLAFFSKSLYETLPAQTKHALMTTFMLEAIDANAAVALSGDSLAMRRLGELHAANLFVERIESAAPQYRYHPAFAAFLREQATASLGADGYRAAMDRAAEHALSVAMPERALALFIEAEAWTSGVDLLLELVEPTLADDRVDQVYRWLTLLPGDILAAHPELQYQRGLAGTLMEDDTASAFLVAAARAFDRAGDTARMLKAAAALMDYAYHEWASFRDYDPWVERLAEVDGDLLAGLPPRDAAVICRGVICAALVSDRALPHAPAILARQGEWLKTESPAVRLLAQVQLLEYASNARDWTAAAAVVAEMDILLAGKRIPVSLRARAQARRCYCFDYRRGDYERAAGIAREVVALARQHGLPFSAREAGITLTLVALMQGELDEAERAIDDELALAEPRHLAAQANACYERAWWHALRDDLTAARREHERAAALFVQAREAGVMSYALPLQLSQLHAAEGDYDAALALVEQGIGAHTVLWRAQRSFIAALRDLARGDADSALVALEGGLVLGRRYELIGSLWAMRKEMAHLMGVALTHGLEPAWAARVIASRRLAPPLELPVEWPWMLRVNLLGAVHVTRSGPGAEAEAGANAGTTRPQRKLLELMCLVLSLPHGEADIARVGGLLWPGTDTASMRRNLDTTLHRLRQWFDVPDVIVVKDGCLLVDRRRVWVDLNMLEVLRGRVMGPARPNVAPLVRQEAGRAAWCATAEDFMALHRVAFGESLDQGLPWATEMAARIRGQVEETLIEIGAVLEAFQEWPLADRLYRHGLMHDRAHEGFYRGRLRCLLAQQEFSLAQRVYRECESALRSMLDAVPAPETVALLAAVKAACPHNAQAVK